MHSSKNDGEVLLERWEGRCQRGCRRPSEGGRVHGGRLIFKISEIDLDDFDQIKIYVESDVVIKQGSKSKIQLEGNVTLVDSIYSNVENNKLIVELKSPYCNPDIPLKISITTPSLKKLAIN